MRRTSPAGEKKAGTAFRRGSLRNLAQSGKGKGKEHGIRRILPSSTSQPRGGGGARAPSEKQRSTRGSTAQAGRHPHQREREEGLGLETFTRKLRENSFSRNAHERWLTSSVFPCSAVERIELTHSQTVSSNCMVSVILILG